ncbi:hypothetical protein Tsubulata_051493, partial [Turnera subulata]
PVLNVKISNFVFFFFLRNEKIFTLSWFSSYKDLVFIRHRVVSKTTSTDPTITNILQFSIDPRKRIPDNYLLKSCLATTYCYTN